MTVAYSASLEWGDLADSAILRLHEGEDRGYGDPYVWCCYVARRGPAAVIKGVMAAPPPLSRSAIRDALLGAGFAIVEFERYKGGRLASAARRRIVAP